MKILFLSLALACNVFFCFAQLPTAALIPVGAKSPDAAILEKFGNIPVGYSTGVPNVNIPIYHIQIGKIDIPISIDYHGSGVRVDDNPSSVGCGWGLNAGGIVSRNMVGRPDEQQYGYLSAASETAIYNNPGHYYQYLYGIGAAPDFEPDVFSYSIGEESGKFVFNKDLSVFQIPRSDNQIQFINNQSFYIKDANGVVYIFDLPETISIADANLNYTSSWRLTKVIDQNQRDTVLLTYNQGAGSEVTHDDVASFTNTPSCSLPAYTWSTTNTTLSNTSTTVSHPYEYFLSSITWRGGKIAFLNTQDRQDRLTEDRLNEIDIYSNVNNNLLKLKAYKLYQSYFYYNSTSAMVFPYSNSDPRNYRLRLDSVGIYSSTGVEKPETYRMAYNSTPMASRESTGVDIWGYNNGHFENQSFLAPETVLDYTQKAYSVGSANRNPDSTYMQACSLQSIQYPTGAKSVFVMEPHAYINPTTMVSKGAGAGVVTGSGPTAYSNNFTLPNTTITNLSYIVNFSSFNYTTQIPQPSITITDQTTGQQQILTSPNNAQAYSSGQVYLTYGNGGGGLNIGFASGHSYNITANIFNNTSQSGTVLANFTLYWKEDDGSTVQIGGGLRVKSITNYDINNNFINQDTYQYGASTSGYGYGGLMTNPMFLTLNNNSSWTYYRVNCIAPPYSDAPISYVYHSNTLAAITQISGSPVLYQQVTKYQSSSSGSEINGKTVYSYALSPDTIAGLYIKGPINISRDWQSNILLEEETYKSINGGTAFTPLVDKSYNYGIDRTCAKTQLKITSNFTNVGGMGRFQDSAHVTSYNSTISGLPNFSFTLYPNTSGIPRLHSQVTTTYSDTGPNVVTVENHYYDDTTHLLPTRIQTFSSKNETLTDSMRYPHDFAVPGNVYTTMLNRNIKAPVVQLLKYRNNTQQTLIKANYADWYGNNALLVPMSVDEQIAANPIETRVKFNKYDPYGNITQQQKTNGVYQSYVWDYSKLYPIAEVNNADSVSIAYTSFEADGTGNWTIPSSLRNTTGFTGRKSYSLSNGAISKSGLATSTTYIVSYWTTNSSPLTITGTLTGYPIIGPTRNGWTYYEHQVKGKTTITLTGTGNIDEVRLYPSNAQMTTYTYDPLVGMTSSTNPKGESTYYEYDNFQRLMNIKNKDGNIIKHIDYHYQGQ